MLVCVRPTPDPRRHFTLLPSFRLPPKPSFPRKRESIPPFQLRRGGSRTALPRLPVSDYTGRALRPISPATGQSHSGARLHPVSAIVKYPFFTYHRVISTFSTKLTLLAPVPMPRISHVCREPNPQTALPQRPHGNASVGGLAYRLMVSATSPPAPGARRTVKLQSSTWAVTPSTLAVTIRCSP